MARLIPHRLHKALDRVIACAVVGGDRDSLALERVGDISILSAARFLESVERLGSEDDDE